MPNQLLRQQLPPYSQRYTISDALEPQIHLLHLLPELLARGLPPHFKATISGFITVERETKEVERCALLTLFPCALTGITAKLDDSALLFSSEIVSPNVASLFSNALPNALASSPY